MQRELIYIDESGHTGDLLTAGSGFGFNGQPHFVLAGVGPMDPDQAARMLANVVAKHRLKMREVKSEDLGKRPAVARDLALALREQGIALFVEAVDKVFYLIVSIVNCHILPPTAGTPLDEEDRYVRNGLADFLYQGLPDEALERFIEACRQDTPEAVRASLEYLLAWARDSDAEDKGERTLLDNIAGSVAESIDDLDLALADDPRGHRRFLPLPDAGKGNATYWVLPNYSSLTNLYARINRYRQGRLKGVALVHDAQTHYDAILREAKAAVERFVDTTQHVHPGADYAFRESATLSFADSKQTPGLMIADVIAGHVRRVLRDHMTEQPIHDTALDAFLSIWNAQDVERGAGLNLVLPTAAVQRLQKRALLRRWERAHPEPKAPPRRQRADQR